MMKRHLTIFAALLVCASVFCTPAAAITLAPGEHAAWIDRIAMDDSWPQETKDFPLWLQEQAELGADGALADVTKAEYYPEYGIYGYTLAVLESEETVRFTPTASQAKNQQAAYEAIEAYMAKSGMKDRIQAIADYAMAALQSVDRDHPEIFWLSGNAGIVLPISYSYSASGEATFTQKILLRLSDGGSEDIRQPAYRDLAAIRADIAVRDAAAEKILAGVPDGSRLDQLAYLHDWLTQNNSYCSSADQPLAVHHCLSALRGSVGEDGPVCEGYARAFKVLCDRLEIPCVLVSGAAKYEADAAAQPHMWNLVQMDDGRWYGVDVTWDDPIFVGADGQRVNDAKSGAESRSYFLVHRDKETDGLRFAQSHTPENRVSLGGPAFLNEPSLADSPYTEAAAAVTVNGGTTYYDSVSDAFAAANGKTAEIQLLRSAETGEIAPRRGTHITLDLNGYTLTGKVGKNGYLLRIGSGSVFILRDSSDEKTGGLRSDGGVLAAKGGTVLLETFG